MEEKGGRERRNRDRRGNGRMVERGREGGREEGGQLGKMVKRILVVDCYFTTH